LLDLLKFILSLGLLRGILDLVGMALENELPVGGLDFCGLGVLGDLEDIVRIRR
jgi:hypothetical protein